jgi:hypothetical protein
MRDLSDIALWMAGEAGQVSLALSGDSDGSRAAVDQHAAAVRDALGGDVSAGVLLSYVRGFVEAAVARGWWPPHRQVMALDPWDDFDVAPELDWESLRLAAVCRLFLEIQAPAFPPALPPAFPPPR